MLVIASEVFYMVDDYSKVIKELRNKMTLSQVR